MTARRCARCGWPLPSGAQLVDAAHAAQERARALDARGRHPEAEELRRGTIRRIGAQLERTLCDVCSCPLCPHGHQVQHAV